MWSTSVPIVGIFTSVQNFGLFETSVLKFKRNISIKFDRFVTISNSFLIQDQFGWRIFGVLRRETLPKENALTKTVIGKVSSCWVGKRIFGNFQEGESGLISFLPGNLFTATRLERADYPQINAPKRGYIQCGAFLNWGFHPMNVRIHFGTSVRSR